MAEDKIRVPVTTKSGMTIWVTLDKNDPTNPRKIRDIQENSPDMQELKKKLQKMENQ